MSLHHLDPRQVGTGAAPDVEVWATWTTKEGERSAFRYGPPCDGPPSSVAIAQRTFATEAAALAAARAAAGFGHVAEQPCNATQATMTRVVRTIPQFLNETVPSDDECHTCTWPRDAHKEGSK